VNWRCERKEKVVEVVEIGGEIGNTMEELGEKKVVL